MSLDHPADSPSRNGVAPESATALLEPWIVRRKRAASFLERLTQQGRALRMLGRTGKRDEPRHRFEDPRRLTHLAGLWCIFFRSGSPPAPRLFFPCRPLP